MTGSHPLFAGKEGYLGLDQDKLMDLFLECTADGFAIIDMDNRFIRLNQMYSQIFGYREEELLGKKFEEFANLGEAYDIVERVKKGMAFTNAILQYSHKNGQILDIAVSYSPFRNTYGDIIAVIGIFRDITPHKNLERELKKSRELYRLITENTTDLIKVISNTKNKIITFASPSHEKVFGWSPAQIVGRSIYDFISHKESKGLDKILKLLADTKEPVLFEYEAMTPEGETLYFEYNISAVSNDKGEIGSFLTVARNITDRIKNEAALRNLDRLSIIGQLAAGVAHEIRNPLTSLKGFSKLLENEPSKVKQVQYLDIIKGELDRIDTIVNEFMSLAKPQAVTYIKCNLLVIIDGTVSILQPQALLNNVQIRTDYPSGEIELFGSPNQLKQVLVNFLKNAIEAMPEGGNVYIKVEKSGPGKVLVTFRDEGMGIDPEKISLLGTPFYTTKARGIGLGLTVSNKIIQEHNGEMRIDSQIGVGTVITLELNCLEN